MVNPPFLLDKTNLLYYLAIRIDQRQNYELSKYPYTEQAHAFGQDKSALWVFIQRRREKACNVIFLMLCEVELRT